MYEEVANQKLGISKVPGAGLGVFAKDSIEFGEDLFEERPLVIIEAFVKQQYISWSEKCDYLRKKVKGLPSNERKQYYQLHDCKQSEGKLHHQEHLMLHTYSFRWQEDLFWDFQNKQLCTGP